MIHLDNSKKPSFRARASWVLFKRWQDIKFMVKQLSVCPLCFWSGDWSRNCPLCKGKGKLTITQRVNYLLYKKEYWK